MTESEVWKDVDGYEGFYQVSNKGRVRSVDRRDPRGHRRRGRMLKPGCNSSGYLIVALYKNGKSKTKDVHRLVARAFIPNPESLSHVNHMDEVKDNNELSNLEWCTHKYNMNYGTLIERISKKVRAVNIETGEVLTFNSTVEAGRNGYSQSGVAAACSGVYTASTGKLIGGDGRTYKGFRWYYDVEEENKSK